VKLKQNGCHELWQRLQLTVEARPASKWLTAAAAASNCTSGAPNCSKDCQSQVCQ
jgi:hypothetical protein